jgi:hypothetical protein
MTLHPIKGCVEFDAAKRKTGGLKLLLRIGTKLVGKDAIAVDVERARANNPLLHRNPSRITLQGLAHGTHHGANNGQPPPTTVLGVTLRTLEGTGGVRPKHGAGRERELDGVLGVLGADDKSLDDAGAVVDNSRE